MSYESLSSDTTPFQKEWNIYYEGGNSGKVLPVIKDLASFIKHQGGQRTSSFFVVSTYSHLPAKKNMILKVSPL